MFHSVNLLSGAMNRTMPCLFLTCSFNDLFASPFLYFYPHLHSSSSHEILSQDIRVFTTFSLHHTWYKSDQIQNIHGYVPWLGSQNLGKKDFAFRSPSPRYLASMKLTFLKRWLRRDFRTTLQWSVEPKWPWPAKILLSRHKFKFWSSVKIWLWPSSDRRTAMLFTILLTL